MYRFVRLPKSIIPPPRMFASEQDEAKQKLNEVIGGSHQVLVTAKTVFPFTLFPDTITVDRQKLTITKRSFIQTAEVMSIRIEDVLNVTANVGPVFGSVTIATRFFDTKKPYTVTHFWRHDALRIKRIMQGYIIATQKDIDCSALSTGELARTLDTLGEGIPQET